MSNYNGQFQDSSANILLPTPHSYANIEGAESSQAYMVGQMVVYNNRLCEIIDTVAQGDTFTIGTNIAYKNVGDIGKQLVATDGTEFYFDVADGKYGYYPSAAKVASEFVPFGGSSIIVYSVSNSDDISGYEDYQNVTVDNLFLKVNSITTSAGNAGYIGATVKINSYNASTGKASLTLSYSRSGISLWVSSYDLLVIR